MKKIVVSAPGKVIIHGEHAVVYGKVCNERFAIIVHVETTGRKRFKDVTLRKKN